jgi:hypothetical protein
LAALVFLLLIVFLTIPFHLDLEFKKRGPMMRGSYKVSWLGITIKKEAIESSTAEDAIASILRDEQGDEFERKTEKMEEQKTRDSQEEDDKPGRYHALPFDPASLLDAFPAIFRVCKDLLKSLSFRNLSCQLCFGLDDPVDTAVMSGYLWAILSALGLFRANILISSSFAGVMLEGDFVAEIRARMLWAMVAMINALREKKIRTLLMEVARS